MMKNNEQLLKAINQINTIQPSQRFTDGKKNGLTFGKVAGPLVSNTGLKIGIGIVITLCGIVFAKSIADFTLSGIRAKQNAILIKKYCKK